MESMIIQWIHFLKMFAFILISCRQLPLFTQIISAFSFARLNSSGNVRFACRDRDEEIEEEGENAAHKDFPSNIVR